MDNLKTKGGKLFERNGRVDEEASTRASAQGLPQGPSCKRATNAQC